jgi:AcrR family transcriptional regulator
MDQAAMINAAERCYNRLGINVATMDDIAAEAGISRRTLYRYMGGSKDILNKVTRRAVDRFWVKFHEDYGQAEDFCEYLVDGLIYTLKHAPKTRMHRLLFDQSLMPLVNAMYIDNPEYVRYQARILGEVYERLKTRPGTRQDLDMLMVCEWHNRLMVSFLSAPSAFFRSERELRLLFSAMLAPAIRCNGAAQEPSGRNRTK